VVVALAIAALLVLIAIAGIGRGPNTPLEEKAGNGTAQDGRGVSASTATLLAASLAVTGTLLGAGLGLFGDRYLRHRGDIVCRGSDWSMTYTLRDLSTPVNTRPVQFSRSMSANALVMERAEHGNYFCSVKLFNETEVATGLRDIRVVFTDDSAATEKVYVPQVIGSRGVLAEPDVLNLPSRQWVNVRLEGQVETEDFEALARSTTAKVRAWLPKDKPFERRIAVLWD